MIMVVFLLLAGCKGVGEAEQSSSSVTPITLEPLSTPYTSGDCTAANVLDEWLQPTTLYHQEFGSYLQTATTVERSELFQNIQRMAQITNLVTGHPAPDCAGEVQRMVFENMQSTLMKLQSYYNGERNDLNAIVTQSAAALRAVDDALLALAEGGA